MPALIACNQDLLMSITGQAEGQQLSLLLDIVGQVRVSGSNTLNRSPIPNGQTSIDHVVRNNDTVSFDAIVGCQSCNASLNGLLNTLGVMKNMASKQVYDNEFLNLFWNHGAATRMILSSYSTRQTQNDVQILNVSMNFEAANIQGEISAPSFEAGGILGL